MKKSVFIVSPGNSDQDVKWGIWVTNKRVSTQDQAMEIYTNDRGEELTAYIGKGDKKCREKAMKLANRIAINIGARKRIVVI